MSYLWIAVPFVLAILGFLAYRLTTAKFFWNLVKEVVRDIIKASIPLFKNKPKTPEQWRDFRNIMAIKPSERTPAERARLREIIEYNKS